MNIFFSLTITSLIIIISVELYIGIQTVKDLEKTIKEVNSNTIILIDKHIEFENKIIKLIEDKIINDKINNIKNNEIITNEHVIDDDDKISNKFSEKTNSSVNDDDINELPSISDKFPSIVYNETSKINTNKKRNESIKPSSWSFW